MENEHPPCAGAARDSAVREGESVAVHTLEPAQGAGEEAGEPWGTKQKQRDGLSHGWLLLGSQITCVTLRQSSLAPSDTRQHCPVESTSHNVKGRHELMNKFVVWVPDLQPPLECKLHQSSDLVYLFTRQIHAG